MNKVLILRGLPGSGKSYFANKLAETNKSVMICSADDYFMVEGKYVYDSSKIGDAHNACLIKFMQAIQNGCPYIVVDNTNCSAWEIAPYYRFAEISGYEVEFIHFKRPAHLCLQRQTHNVPDFVVGMMAERLNDALPGHWKVAKDW